MSFPSESLERCVSHIKIIQQIILLTSNFQIYISILIFEIIEICHLHCNNIIDSGDVGDESK